MAATYARRHYEATAAILKASKPDVDGEHPLQRAVPDPLADLPTFEAANRVWHDIHGAYVNLYAEDNPRFIAERFNRACGLS